jgi:23S rRNA pseudouridine2605 synthase/16S rRNA pseudouridine516 synthase
MPRGRPPRWLLAAKAQDRSPQGGLDWLSRALPRAGVLPPEDAEKAILAGRVRVNGQVRTQPLAPVARGDRVELDGREVDLSPRTRALMFHKPKGIVSAPRDPEGVGTVFQALHAVLPEALRGFGWHAVGRLDRNTTGLLLFTNDERLVAHVTSPRTHLSKRYLAKVSGTPTEAKLEPLRRGIVLDDGPARPAQARLLEDGRVELTISEGRHHQVKRMLGAVGLPVLELHREAVGALVLDVPEGELRELTEDELTRALRYSRPP